MREIETIISVRQSFSQNLRKQRKAKGWTQEETAETLTLASGKKIHPSTYCLIEKGEVKASIEVLPAIVEVFSIDDLYLFLTKS